MAIVGLLCVTSCGEDESRDLDEAARLTVGFEVGFAGVEAWDRVVGAIVAILNDDDRDIEL